MSERDERVLEELIEEAKASYNVPGPTPREAMWRAIEGELELVSVEDRDEVVDLEAERARRRSLPAVWVAAAAAVLLLGIGIGRRTAPTVPLQPGPTVTESAPSAEAGVRLAALEHLGRSESLLAMVRAEGRSGSLEGTTAAWARELLGETRLLLDAQTSDADPALSILLEDLELVLAQIVGAAEVGAEEGSRAGEELRMTLEGLEEGEVLARIREAIPVTLAGA